MMFDKNYYADLEFCSEGYIAGRLCSLWRLGTELFLLRGMPAEEHAVLRYSAPSGSSRVRCSRPIDLYHSSQGANDVLHVVHGGMTPGEAEEFFSLGWACDHVPEDDG